MMITGCNDRRREALMREVRIYLGKAVELGASDPEYALAYEAVATNKLAIVDRINRLDEVIIDAQHLFKGRRA